MTISTKISTVCLIAFFSLLASHLQAQNELYVQPGAIISAVGRDDLRSDSLPALFVGGDILALPGSQMNNLGSEIQLSGNWTNLGTYTSDGGYERFVGSTTQQIGGIFDGNSSNQLTNMIIGKESAIFNPDSKIQLVSDINVDSAIVWTTGGNLDVNSNMIYLKNWRSDAMTGYIPVDSPETSVDRMLLIPSGVGGTMKREVTKGYFYDYPIHNNFGFNPITIDVQASSPFASFTSDVEMGFDSWVGSSVNHTEYLSPLSCFPSGSWIQYDCFANNGIWRIDGRDDGNLHYIAYGYMPIQEIIAGPCPPSSQIVSFRTLRHDNNNVLEDWSGSVNNNFLESEDGHCLRLDASTLNDLIGAAIPGGVYTKFSALGIGSGSNSGFNLPIELIYLDAFPLDNEKIRVQWATAIEIDNQKFEVYRSTDLITYNLVGTLPAYGDGNSAAEQVYHFDDYEVVPNVTYYYKLKQIDIDASSEEFGPVAAELSAEGIFVISEFQPNPATDFSNLHITTSAAQDLHFEVYDNIGRLIERFDQPISVGKNSVKFSTLTKADGIYHVLIHSSHGIQNRKLVLSR